MTWTRPPGLLVVSNALHEFDSKLAEYSMVKVCPVEVVTSKLKVLAARVGLARISGPAAPPELPVLNEPTVLPANGLPSGSWPDTDQRMPLLAGNAGAGVQVRTVLSVLQA